MGDALKITKRQAKRFLLLKHGLLGAHKFEGKQGIYDYVRQAGCLQYDPIDVCGKNHELVLFSKVKGFSKEDIYSLLYDERRLIDWFDKCMSIMPMDDWPYFENARKTGLFDASERPQVDEAAERVLEYIKLNGAICSSDIESETKADWYWGPTSIARAALERLYYRGRLIIHHKKNTRKFYDLPERHIDDDLLNMKNPNETLQQQIDWHVLRRIGGVGMLHRSASDALISIGGMKAAERDAAFDNLMKQNLIVEVHVDGIQKPFYYKAEDMPIMQMAASEDEYMKRVEFIAPLDNMMWDRNIINELFDFHYRWEIYTPAAKRAYGYYVLPVLNGEEMAGRIEIKRDKKAKRMMIENMWIDDGDKRLLDEIDKKIILMTEAL